MMAKETTLEEIGEMLSRVVEHMATKEELTAFREEAVESFREFREELAEIRRDLEELKPSVDNTTGYSKEIDHALARIARIEKHLGINTKATA